MQYNEDIPCKSFCVDDMYSLEIITFCICSELIISLMLTLSNTSYLLVLEFDII